MPLGRKRAEPGGAPPRQTEVARVPAPDFPVGEGTLPLDADPALLRASGKDVDFYTGKIAAAQFFARQVLPRLAAERAIAEASDNDLMEVPESAF